MEVYEGVLNLRGPTVLKECSAENCKIQFDVESEKCPVCGAANLYDGEPHVDHEFHRSESRRRMLIGAVAGLVVVFYLFSLFKQLSSGLLAAVPFTIVWVYLGYRFFRSATSANSDDPST